MRRRGWLACLVLASALVVLTAGPALGATRDPGQAVSHGQTSRVSSTRGGSYWTERRKRAATPMEATRTTRPGPHLTGVPRVGRSPGHVAGSVPSQARSGINASVTVGPATYDYPYPFTRRTVESQLRTVYPYRTVGKVFLRQDGVDYVCSGSSVASEPRNVVFTAGHCLHDGAGHWSSNVVFVPGRRTGSSPYGSFAARHLWVMQGWIDGADFAFDQAAFDVGRNSSHQTLQSRVGALGFAWDQARVQHWDLFGYPAASPFTGERLVTCEASHAVDDASQTGYDTIGLGCDMTGGSSGGPWILGLGRGNLINGLVSYGYEEQPKAIYSSYFSADSNALRCAAATGDATVTSC